MANELKLEGFKEFQDKLKNLAVDVLDEIDGKVEDAATMWEERAKLDAPVDQAILRNNITARHIGHLNAEVTSSAEYSAFIEWGTGKRVSVPADMQTYASQFKGTGGGTIDQFFLNIYEWVKRKGIAATFSVKTRKRTKSKGEDDRTFDLAFLIMMSILKNGIKPQPFFFIQKPIVENFLISEIKEILKKQR